MHAPQIGSQAVGIAPVLSGGARLVRKDRRQLPGTLVPGAPSPSPQRRQNTVTAPCFRQFILTLV